MKPLTNINWIQLAITTEAGVLHLKATRALNSQEWKYHMQNWGDLAWADMPDPDSGPYRDVVEQLKRVSEGFVMG